MTGRLAPKALQVSLVDLFDGDDWVMIRESSASSHLHLSPPKPLKRLKKIGGAREDRTPDLLNAIQALSHLSYDPISVSGPAARFNHNDAGRVVGGV